MVASKHNLASTTYGYPTGCLKSLCSLIDEQCAKLHAIKQSVGTAYKGTGYDTRLAKQFGIDAYFQLCGTTSQAFHLLMKLLIATLSVSTQLTNGLTNAPQLRIVGMSLKATLVGKRQHLVVDTRRVAYSQDVDATVNKFLTNPVDSHITLSTHQHLILAAQGFIDSLNKRGCLARSWRTVHHCHILGTQHLVDRLFLCGIEIREAHGLKGKALCFLRGIEKVAKITKSALATHGALKCLEHQAVTCFIKRQLHSYSFVTSQ